MKILLYLSIFFLIISCSVKKGSYWCGDHPCINKQEKEAYFKKTMIVEIKQAKKKFKDNDSEFLKIMEQAHKEEKERKKNEKNLSKQLSLDEKRKAKEEKYLLKQAKLEEKRKAKEEKYLARKIKKDEKKIIKSKKISKIINSEPVVPKTLAKTNTSRFSNLLEKIIKRNRDKPYPDINDIPN